MTGAIFNIASATHWISIKKQYLKICWVNTEIFYEGWAECLETRRKRSSEVDIGLHPLVLSLCAYNIPEYQISDAWPRYASGSLSFKYIFINMKSSGSLGLKQYPNLLFSLIQSSSLVQRKFSNTIPFAGAQISSCKWLFCNTITNSVVYAFKAMIRRVGTYFTAIFAVASYFQHVGWSYYHFPLQMVLKSKILSFCNLQWDNGSCFCSFLHL